MDRTDPPATTRPSPGQPLAGDPPPASDTTPLLLVDGLCKSFAGLRAAIDVRLEVARGTATALIGPNGAGKTTVFSMIAGYLKPDAGSVVLDGQDLTGASPERMSRAGLARTFQSIRVFDRLSVIENVLVGMTQFARTRTIGILLRTRAMRREEAAMRDRAAELVDLVGLTGSADAMAGSLPYGRRKVLELAMALASEPRLLLLDEPAAGLNPTEKHELLGLLREVHASGLALLVIEHDVRFVTAIASEVTVMDFGSVVATGSPEEIVRHEQVIKVYLGSGFGA